MSSKSRKKRSWFRRQTGSFQHVPLRTHSRRQKEVPLRSPPERWRGSETTVGGFITLGEQLAAADLTHRGSVALAGSLQIDLLLVIAV